MVEGYANWIGIFIGLLTAMAITHITNAVIFKLELKKEYQSLKAAYQFPLVQLSRLGQAYALSTLQRLPAEQRRGVVVERYGWLSKDLLEGLQKLRCKVGLHALPYRNWESGQDGACTSDFNSMQRKDIVS